jgi:hypothetical protein
MAKIKQGILGGFSGSVAGVVGTSWKGRAVMKAKPLSVANPKTEGQVSQRTSFKGVAQVGSAILVDVVRRMYNAISGDISGYNLFTSQNKQMFDGTGAFQVSESFIGGGTLLGSEIDDIEILPDGDSLELTLIDNSPAGSPRKQDQVVAWAIEPISGTIWTEPTVYTREETTCQLKKGVSGSDLTGQLQVFVFVGYISADGRLASVKQAGEQFVLDFSA